ncbi:enoyl-CoA hydratase/isomerase family protein [Xylophilus sp. GW821-FHT01B05]
MSSSIPAPSVPLLSIDGAVATITLNRPAHRNRLQDEDLQTLLAHFAQVDANPAVRVLVLAAVAEGARPVFSAGYHVGGFDVAPGAQAGTPLAFEAVPDALERLRPLTICALNGSVYGGATDLALACDFRLGVQGMELRMPAAALGLHYYPSGLVRYVSRLGTNASKRLFLRAEAVDAEALLAMGYLDQLLPAAELPAAVQALAARLAQLAPLAAQGIKQSINEIARQVFDTAVIQARVALCQASADFAEGLQAFAERRTPVFSGV